MSINIVGVVGAGLMGSGIAQISAQAGFQVVLQDVEYKFVERGIGMIKANLDKAVTKGKLDLNEAMSILTRIKGTTNLKDLQEADFVIEAIIENIELKKNLFSDLDKLCKTDAIFATNTSGLSITEIAAATGRQERVIGMHFFNPVPVMKLVEIIRGAKTSNEVLELTNEVARRMGKEAINVKEAPLFAVNRILAPMLNEAMFVLAEGIASAEDIDKGMCLGANHPIGPLALADLVGLDTLLFVLDTLYHETADSKYRPCPLLKQKVRAGDLGRKSGKGFYIY